jgi:SOS response regulatory protein OraA/RecX
MTTRKPRQLDETGLREFALKSLAVRSSSEAEMRTKLERRAIRKTDVEVVMRRLKEVGFLNDARLAEHVAGWRLETQRLGKRRVERDLRARKIAPKLVENAVASAFEGVDETALIREHIAKRIRRSGKPEPGDRKKLASLFRHLIGAGFSPSQIFPELRRISKSDADAIEEEAESAI